MKLSDINTAVQFINEGKLVIFPTETVYGIGADATNDSACQNIYKVKARPINNPLIIHVSNIQAAQTIGIFNDLAIKLATLWPGPISLIVPLNKSAKISSKATANLDTVAIRIPAHKTALRLLQLTQKPIAAPSANISGYLSPTTYQHANIHFQNSPEIFILKGQRSAYGLESTIIDTTTAKPTILRHGFITQEIIRTITGQNSITPEKKQHNNLLKAPGMMLKHYSPITKIRLNAIKLFPKEVGLNYGCNVLQGKYCLNLSPSTNLIEAATNLYHMLHQLDNYAQNPLNQVNTIAIAPIPNIGIGVAINDKLNRASTY
ncbi:tRNA threonylcarbamoyl adenosine modification protein, Sua5/YciO/YrdC/YwlC family [Orientia chuto str. Dubai]|uniref:Threonylcarbamoyl-AMP synthase n=1 Tax=Orientia chuto str. Dubai TaxID=1359168 RepID=A0A0F3MLD5_9RICK|nr:L-threonylcarbamoyladenylate synthase [Candidatus Orientia mediorientalis]KJV56558.1 tRNA threonylcarbamoyl adenosine modification protein, Sua5/YciO/YrdC/YwlC family [Orientia chuto str. Dubai]